MDEDWMIGAFRFWAVGCVISLILVGILGGSFRTEVTFTPEATTATTAATAGKAFEEDLHARHWLGGLVQGRQPDLQEALAKYGGGRLSRLSIVTRHTLTDLLVSIITVGVYCPETVTVRGQIVPATALSSLVGSRTEASQGLEGLLRP